MFHQKIRVGVLRGGPSSEYEVSLKTGNAILKNLPEKYRGIDIFISRDGTWHVDGMPRDPQRAVSIVDVIFNAMHGEYGEDGKVQRILEHLAVPYTGSQTLPSALAMNKHLAKSIFRYHNLRTPNHMLVTNDMSTRELAVIIFKTFPIPAVIKPVSARSSVGISMANTLSELEAGLIEAFKYGNKVIVEEKISGREATCGVIDNFRNERVYSLLPVEVVKQSDREFFDYHAKCSGKSKEICPGNFSRAEKDEIQRLAKEAHRHLGLRHYSRSDFIIHPKRGVYILETNNLPGLTKESLFPKSLEAIGSDLPQFLDHILSETIAGR